MNNEEHAERHCLMVSEEAGDGTPGSAIIWVLTGWTTKASRIQNS